MDKDGCKKVKRTFGLEQGLLGLLDPGAESVMLIQGFLGIAVQTERKSCTPQRHGDAESESVLRFDFSRRRFPLTPSPSPALGRGEPMLAIVAVSDRLVEVLLLFAMLDSSYRFFQRMPSFVSSMT